MPSTAGTQVGSANVDVYMQVKANGSDVAGSSRDADGHPDWCDVLGFTYSVAKGDQGAAKGGRIGGGRTVAGEFVVTKEMDKASPLLLQALAQNQDMEVLVECWRDKPAGNGREKFFTFTLKHARITSMRPFTQAGSDATFPFLEEVGIQAGEVIVTHVDGGIEFEHNFMRSDV
jgi:type VI secretion system Hcp family effector